ncbi:MAG: chromate efflux transporter [Gammaproteobacteria bacterium]|nr:chromate efflux transporter [Gammaproteobacteria bacterium]
MHPVLEVFGVFLRLGVSSFGGPVAHLGYFHDELVRRRGWLGAAAYAELVALCQFLPGPASSQVGFALGLVRAGYPGALAAWLGFTLPSALLMYLFARTAHGLANAPPVVHALMLVAVAVVAQAIVQMGRRFSADPARGSITLAAALLVLALPAGPSQLAALALGALLGRLLCHEHSAPAQATPLATPVSRRTALSALAAFLVLLVLPPLLPAMSVPAAALFNACYRAGALVFGGGHVVLPLLRAAFVSPGWITDPSFLAGYGAAQALPGPLFSFAAYLGALAHPGPQGPAGALLGILGIFLPGMLVLLAALPFWNRIRARPEARSTLAGINAAVVGLLAAALAGPLWSSAVHSRGDAALALGGFLLLTAARVPPFALVVVGVLAAAALSWAGR